MAKHTVAIILPTHSIDVNELKTNPSALHNTKEKKEQRALMLKGERPKVVVIAGT